MKEKIYTLLIAVTIMLGAISLNAFLGRGVNNQNPPQANPKIKVVDIRVE